MEFKNIIFEKNQGVATITLNRPEALNAFSSEVIEEVLRAIEDVKKDTDIRVLVLTGAGEKAFSAGADIKAMEQVFQKILPSLSDNIQELGRITQDIKKKKEKAT